MSKHLTEERLWSRAQGEGLAEAEREHLGACPACRERLACGGRGPGPRAGGELRAGAVARVLAGLPASGGAPHRRGARAVLGRGLAPSLPARASRSRGSGRARAGSSPDAGAPGSSPSTGGPNLPAWEALPAANDDGSLDVLRGLALSGDGLEEAATCRDLADCLGALTDEESLHPRGRPRRACRRAGRERAARAPRPGGARALAPRVGAAARGGAPPSGRRAPGRRLPHGRRLHRLQPAGERRPLRRAVRQGAAAREALPAGASRGGRARAVARCARCAPCSRPGTRAPRRWRRSSAR